MSASFDKFKDIPGKVVMEIKAFQKGDPNFQVEVNNLLQDRGVSIAQLRESFGGKDEGYLEDGFKHEKHPISLCQWEKADAETTFLNIGWHYVFDESLLPDHPAYPTPPWHQK